MDLTPSLVPAHYVDPDVYDREVHAVLGAGWLPLCRADELPEAGDRYAGTVLGRPVVAVRDRDGAVHVHANVCPHRGSVLVDEGLGHGSTIQCPYHRWAFRSDGSFVGGPLTDGADLDGVCLTPVRHVCWQGFVLVNPSGDADDPSDDLAGLVDQIAPWRWDELVTVAAKTFESTWNWKVMVENWIECYHHLGTHRDTLEPFQPARGTRIVDSSGRPWVAMTVGNVEGLAGEPDTWIPGLTAEQADHLSIWAAFPLLLAGSMPGYAFWLRVEPLAVDRHLVTWHLLVHPDQRHRFTDEVVAHELEIFTAVHTEDMAACERVQTGLASGQAGRFRLTALEAPIAEFQRWVAGRVRG